MRAVALLVVALMVAAGCGDEDASATPLTVGEALEASGTVMVRGTVFVESAKVRLCGAILESYPPQCGGRALVVLGLDLSTVDLEEPNDPSLAPVKWTERQVTLQGRLDGDRLVDARLSG